MIEGSAFQVGILFLRVRVACPKLLRCQKIEIESGQEEVTMGCATQSVRVISRMAGWSLTLFVSCRGMSRANDYGAVVLSILSS